MVSTAIAEKKSTTTGRRPRRHEAEAIKLNELPLMRSPGPLASHHRCPTSKASDDGAKRVRTPSIIMATTSATLLLLPATPRRPTARPRLIRRSTDSPSTHGPRRPPPHQHPAIYGLGHASEFDAALSGNQSSSEGPGHHTNDTCTSSGAVAPAKKEFPEQKENKQPNSGGTNQQQDH